MAVPLDQALQRRDGRGGFGFMARAEMAERGGQQPVSRREFGVEVDRPPSAFGRFIERYMHTICRVTAASLVCFAGISQAGTI